MNPIVLFWITFVVLAAIVFVCDRKYSMLRDVSTADPRPYSFSKVQLAWWTVIILTSLITIVLIAGDIPTFNESTLILFGITTATTAAGRLVDVSDESKGLRRAQDEESESLFLDILSDHNGVSITRLQTVIFNVVFGLWFMYEVLHRLVLPGTPMNEIIPYIETNNLILLGLSSATYAAFKTTESKKP